MDFQTQNGNVNNIFSDWDWFNNFNERLAGKIENVACINKNSEIDVITLIFLKKL